MIEADNAANDRSVNSLINFETGETSQKSALRILLHQMTVEPPVENFDKIIPLAQELRDGQNSSKSQLASQLLTEARFFKLGRVSRVI